MGIPELHHGRFPSGGDLEIHPVRRGPFPRVAIPGRDSGRHADRRVSDGEGGHGKAGIHKGRWNQNEPKWQPKVGFNCPTGKSLSSINLRDLSRFISSTSADKDGGDGIETIDLTMLGYDKLLGAGIVGRPLRIKVDSASESAIRKISEAGGEVVISE